MNPKVTGQCGRCHMIGIDQDTGTKTKEPLLSLSAHRSGKVSLNSCIFVLLMMLVSWQLWALKCLHTKSWNASLVFSYTSSSPLACTWPTNLQTALLQQVLYLLGLSYSHSCTAHRNITLVRFGVNMSVFSSYAALQDPKISPVKQNAPGDAACLYLCMCTRLSYVLLDSSHLLPSYLSVSYSHSYSSFISHTTHTQTCNNSISET